ncbi:cupin domain-containing protein [Allokutzneria oryzae]|uniref:Cupin domain-containing protein n=1 Tax=Allokutzneria oryzae TaxID=1378989 RepID=A0ABV5ZY69_9PSEU
MTEWTPLRAVEGQAMIGGEGRYRVRGRSEHGVLLEITYPAGVASPVHVHDHDSHVYLMRGHVVGTLDGEPVELRAGEVVVHPRGVPHSVEAVAESTWLEFKSPPTIPLA